MPGLQLLDPQQLQQLLTAFEVSADEQAACKKALAKQRQQQQEEQEKEARRKSRSGGKRNVPAADGEEDGGEEEAARNSGGRKAKRQRAAGPASSADGSSGGVVTTNPYELARLEQIRRNQERLAALNLPGLAADFAANVAPPKAAAAGGGPRKGVGTGGKRSRTAEQLPPRHSLRVRGIGPDGATAGGIEHEGRDGKVVLANGAGYGVMGAGGVVEAVGGRAKGERYPPGELGFRSVNWGEKDDAGLLEVLREACGVQSQQAEEEGVRGGEGEGIEDEGGVSGEGKENGVGGQQQQQQEEKKEEEEVFRKSKGKARGAAAAAGGGAAKSTASPAAAAAAARAGGGKVAKGSSGAISKSNSISSSSSSSVGAGVGVQQLLLCQLVEEDVAKMTKDGVTCLAFHPNSSRLLLAAGDKSGKVRSGAIPWEDA